MVDPRQASTAPDVSVVLPTYNEAGHIVPLLTLIASTLEEAGLTHEIVVIDDDSPDDTSGVVAAHFADDPRVRCVRRRDERGLGSAVGRGIGVSRGATVAVLDADFNHDPRMIPSMLALLHGADLVIGSRYVQGGGMLDRRRYWASYLFNLLIRLLVLTRVHDNLSGYFIGRRSWLRSVVPETVFYGYGDYFIRLISLARRGSLGIVETPVMYGARPTGYSKTSFLRTPVRYLSAALRLAIRSDRPAVEAPPRTTVASSGSSVEP